MGKRSGEFVTLREVLDEVGVDAARFFFLMRKSDTQLEFDLDLAKKKSAENPVFYVQYAHSRITSILGQAESRGIPIRDPENVNLERLDLEEESGLTEMVTRFPEVVAGAAAELEPHRIAFYLIELAGEFHRYYNRHQVLGRDIEVTQARLLLVRVIRDVVAAGLKLLGVSAPDRM
jgi:arginyl-tRNA synthetase